MYARNYYHADIFKVCDAQYACCVTLCEWSNKSDKLGVICKVDRRWWLKEWDRFYGVFVVTVHKGACETGGRLVEGLDVLFAQDRVLVTRKPDRSILITIMIWHFLFTLWMLVFFTLKTNMVLELRAISIPVVKGLSARDVYLTPLISACLMWWNGSTTIEHIYNESVNKIDSCGVTFDNNDWWNLLP